MKSPYTDSLAHTTWERKYHIHMYVSIPPKLRFIWFEGQFIKMLNLLYKKIEVSYILYLLNV